VKMVPVSVPVTRQRHHSHPARTMMARKSVLLRTRRRMASRFIVFDKFHGDITRIDKFHGNAQADRDAAAARPSAGPAPTPRPSRLRLIL